MAFRKKKRKFLTFSPSQKRAIDPFQVANSRVNICVAFNWFDIAFQASRLLGSFHGVGQNHNSIANRDLISGSMIGSMIGPWVVKID